MLQGKELDDAILAAKAAVVPPIDYELLVFESPEKTAGKDDGDVFAFRRPSSSEWYRYRSEWLTEQPAVQAGAVQALSRASAGSSPATPELSGQKKYAGCSGLARSPKGSDPDGRGAHGIPRWGIG